MRLRVFLPVLQPRPSWRDSILPARTWQVSLFVEALCLACFIFVATSYGGDKSPLRLTLTDSPLAVTFTNVGKEPLRILRPLDGSEEDLLMPHYRLSITDSKGRVPPYLPGCGNYGLWANRKWPDDYIVVIPPGGTFVYRAAINRDLTVSGEYTFRFQYIFRPTAKRHSSPLSETFEYPDDIWVGEATSNEVKKVLSLPPMAPAVPFATPAPRSR